MDDIKLTFVGSGLVILAWGCVPPTEPVDIGVAALSLVSFVVLLCFVKERLRRIIQGYYVYMRGGVEGGEVRYNESGKEIKLCFARKKRTIYFPTNTKWKEIMPDWAKGKREDIIARVRKRVSRTWKFEEVDD
jgi:hypothetical protein